MRRVALALGCTCQMLSLFATPQRSAEAQATQQAAASDAAGRRGQRVPGSPHDADASASGPTTSTPHSRAAVNPRKTRASEARREPRDPTARGGTVEAPRAASKGPTAATVVAAALRAAGESAADLAAMARRARRSGLLPRLSLQARRGQAVDLSAVTGSSDSLRTSTDDDLMLQATLTFDLSRLWFAPPEVAIAREQRTQRSRRLGLVREVLALYFERQRLLLEQRRAVDADPELAARTAEVEALLDAFTDGAFRRMLQAGQRPPRQPSATQ